MQQLGRHIAVSNYKQNFTQNSSLKVNFICGQNIWELSMWIVTSLDNYKSYIVHLSKIGKNWEYSGVGLQVHTVLHKAYD
jgi:hypothetical protein